MRTIFAGLTVVALTAWSLDSSAQLLPPPPMQAPPGSTPAPSPWGLPTMQPLPPLQPNTTAQQLDAGDAANSFRGFEIMWTNLEAGGGYVGLPAKLGYPSTGTGGAAFGLGFGARFVTWTLGLRARVMPTSSFTLVQGMLEAGYHLPLGAWDPYVNLRGGYATMLLKGQATVTLPSAPGITPGQMSLDLPNAHGVDLGASIGDDYYFSALFSLGLDVSFDAMFLSQSGASNGAFAIASGSGIGMVVVGSLHGGLHFDL